MQHFDIIIVGGGLTGLCCAAALAQIAEEMAPDTLSVAIVDSVAPNLKILPEFDGRASSLAMASFNLLQNLRILDADNPHLGPIKDMHIFEAALGLSDHMPDLKFQDKDCQKPIGYMIENRHLRAALLKYVSQSPSVTFLAPAHVDEMISGQEYSHLNLQSGQQIGAKLIIAADGADSLIRRQAGINSAGWPYKQKAIVTTISHQLSHHQIARQSFFSGGPFAILPLASDPLSTGEDFAYRSQIVWSDKSAAAEAAYNLEDDLFQSELARRIGSRLGAIKLAAPRWIYPLKLQMAEQYVTHRVALIGDAAHLIHPIAGQGLNLGLRDVAALAESIKRALRLSLELGTPDMLGAYAQARELDGHKLAAATDMFTRLFSNDIGLLRHVRRAGLNVVDQLPFLQSFFMNEASGLKADRLSTRPTVPLS